MIAVLLKIYLERRVIAAEEILDMLVGELHDPAAPAQEARVMFGMERHRHHEAAIAAKAEDGVPADVACSVLELLGRDDEVARGARYHGISGDERALPDRV